MLLTWDWAMMNALRNLVIVKQSSLPMKWSQIYKKYGWVALNVVLPAKYGFGPTPVQEGARVRSLTEKMVVVVFEDESTVRIST